MEEGSKTYGLRFCVVSQVTLAHLSSDCRGLAPALGTARQGSPCHHGG